MKLWSESQVAPYMDEEAVERHARRKTAGLKGAQTRRKRVKDWFARAVERDPQLKSVLEELYSMHVKIGNIHAKKESCRSKDPTSFESEYWDYGVEHCAECARWTEMQNGLRIRREQLFEWLEEASGMDIKMIQLARKYLREDNELTARLGLRYST